MTPTLFFPLKSPVRRKRRGGPDAAPAPAALVLVAAEYETATSITLTFNRAIDIGSLVPSEFVLDDGPGEGVQYEGNPGAVLVNPTTVQIPLAPIDQSMSAAVLLNVGASNGIVAQGDAAAWAGAAGLELPFP